MIRITVPEDAERCVVVATSPVLECVLSLHVLLGPRHHALQHSWMRRMRSLEPALRRDIERFGWVFRTHIPDLFLPGADSRAGTFDASLRQLRRMPADRLLDAFARPLCDHGGRRTLRRKARGIALERSLASGRHGRATAALLFDDPTVFADGLSRVLTAYWETSFRRDWEYLEEPLAQSKLEAERVLAAAGIWAALGRLPTHCRVSADRRELQVELPHEHRVEASATRPLVLSPSFFAWPHVIVNCDAPWPLAAVYTAPVFAREVEPRHPPAELVSALSAVADDTRLRILKLIAERPRTTQELEPLVGLSRAGLSKGLRRLAEAGLIAGRREGYYVVYSLNAEQVRAIEPALWHHLAGDASFARSR